MYDALEPFASGHLPVSDGNVIYWESSGNPKGKPAIFMAVRAQESVRDTVNILIHKFTKLFLLNSVVADEVAR